MLKHVFAALPIALVLLACSSSSDDAPQKGELLAECASPQECDIPLCLTFRSNPQNKKGICTAQCKTNADCGSNTCTALPPELSAGNLTNVCLASCAHDADCTNGFVCTLFPEGNVCYARLAGDPVPCVADDDCTATKGKCGKLKTDAGDRKVCTGDLSAPDAFSKECPKGPTDCAGLTCFKINAVNAQNKTTFCTAECTTDADCPNGMCGEIGGAKLCLKSCSGDPDCANGFACIPYDAATPDKKTCFVSNP